MTGLRDTIPYQPIAGTTYILLVCNRGEIQAVGQAKTYVIAIDSHLLRLVGSISKRAVRKYRFSRYAWHQSHCSHIERTLHLLSTLRAGSQGHQTRTKGMCAN